MKRMLALSVVLMLTSLVAFGDIPRPGKSPSRVEKPKPGIAATMEIKLDREAKEARLIIPKSQVKQLRAELEQLDNDADDTAAATGGVSRTQTIVSGTFLSLAFVFGGIWFVRSGKAATKTGKTFVILAVLAGIGSAATLVYANAGPPPEARSITSKLFDQKVFFPYRFASGKIKIETSDGKNVQLIVPDASAAPSGEE